MKKQEKDLMLDIFGEKLCKKYKFSDWELEFEKTQDPAEGGGENDEGWLWILHSTYDSGFSVIYHGTEVEFFIECTGTVQEVLFNYRPVRIGKDPYYDSPAEGETKFELPEWEVPVCDLRNDQFVLPEEDVTEIKNRVQDYVDAYILDKVDVELI